MPADFYFIQSAFFKRILRQFPVPHLQSFLASGKISYSSLGIIFDFLLLYCIYLLFKKDISLGKERAYLIYTGIGKLFHFVFADKLKKELAVSKEEKISLLFYLVKIFW